MMDRMSDLVQSFLGEMDSFLALQFEVAINGGDIEKILEGQARLVQALKKYSFEASELDSVKLKWIESLESSTAVIGLPQFGDLKLPQTELETLLNRERSRIDSAPFLHLLSAFKDRQFDRIGTHLNVHPSEWLKKEDVPLGSEMDPYLFLEKMFAVTKFKEFGANYTFRKSINGGFFMAPFFLSSSYSIGHGPTDTLFKLSTLAHEIGHTTTNRGRNPHDRFLEIMKHDELIPISNEVESYSYEQLFMENLDHLVGDQFDELTIKSFRDKLRKIKAIQFNLHLLAHRLNLLYFSGSDLSSISLFFNESMSQIFPAYQLRSSVEWVERASLSEPLSKLGYLRAYEKTFAQTKH
jgi:hypothetical protein